MPRVSQDVKDALLKIYESGGDKVRRPEEPVIRSLYSQGLLKSHDILCWKWATYELTSKGIDTAAGFYDDDATGEMC